MVESCARPVAASSANSGFLANELWTSFVWGRGAVALPSAPARLGENYRTPSSSFADLTWFSGTRRTSKANPKTSDGAQTLLGARLKSGQRGRLARAGPRLADRNEGSATSDEGRHDWLEPLLPFRPASRGTAQARRLCYQRLRFQICSWWEALKLDRTQVGFDLSLPQ